MMQLARYIREHMADIQDEWDVCASELAAPEDRELCEALRSHAETILQGVASDLERSASGGPGEAPATGAKWSPPSCSDPHLLIALAQGQSARLDPTQLCVEFTSLRTIVLRLWLGQLDGYSIETLEQVIRFSDAIAKRLGASMIIFSDRVQHARDMFDAILGHDLRGPLASVAFAGEMLTRPGLSTQKASELGTCIKRSGQFMQNMVDDLLQYSRTRMSGGIPLKLEDLNIEEVCETALRDARAMHPASAFEFHSSGTLDARLDRYRMHQLLVNLLGNAGQHGAPHRPVRLQASSDADRLDLCISNEGPAIGEEHLKHIFDPLMQVGSGDKAGTSSTSLGLGLHIAREIALAHGGAIDVSSSSERTAFTVHLPRHLGS